MFFFLSLQVNIEEERGLSLCEGGRAAACLESLSPSPASCRRCLLSVALWAPTISVLRHPLQGQGNKAKLICVTTVASIVQRVFPDSCVPGGSILGNFLVDLVSLCKHHRLLYVVVVFLTAVIKCSAKAT